MCPACFAAAAALALKAVSVGGVAAYGATKLRSKTTSKPIEPASPPRGDAEWPRRSDRPKNGSKRA